MTDLFGVIEDNDDFVVVNKPAGLVCHPTKGDARSSLVSRLRLYLGFPAHLINRIDRETSGLVLAAKNKRVAAELGKIWERRAVEKIYKAIVHGTVAAGPRTIEAPLGRDDRSPIAVKDCVRPDGAVGLTEVFCEEVFERGEGRFSVVEARPRTGRKHQIRIHLAHVGHPIVGDKLYGEDEMFYLRFVRNELSEEDTKRLILTNHALHAWRLRFVWEGRDLQFEAPPEAAFSQFIAGGWKQADAPGVLRA